MTLRDYAPISTPAAIKDFVESRLHVDFQNEIDVRVEHLRDALEGPEEGLADGITHEMTRGAVKVLRQIKDVFSDLLTYTDIQEED